MQQQHFKLFARVELQFATVRVDLPEQTKWLLHNRILRKQWRKYFVTIIHHKRARCPNTKHIISIIFIYFSYLDYCFVLLCFVYSLT